MMSPKGETVTDDRLQQLIDAGYPGELVSLVADLPPDTPWYAEPAGGKADFHHIKASVDSEGAVYLDDRHMMVALDPEDAGRLAARLGTRVEPRNPTTWRLQILPEHADDPALREVALEAIVLSVRRSASRSGRDRQGRAARSEAARAVCPECFVELPVNGVCEIHGASQQPADDVIETADGESRGIDRLDPEHLREARQVALDSARAAGAIDPDDVAQDTLIKYALESSTTEVDDWRAWIWTVARNRVRDLQRGQGRFDHRDVADHDEFRREFRQLGPSQEAMHGMILRDVLDELSERDRSVFLDRFEAGLSAEETAERHGVTKATVDQIVWRGRQMLAEKFPSLTDILGEPRGYQM
jgi:RNA polymerase sigma factor (sigma-70 family)